MITVLSLVYYSLTGSSNSAKREMDAYTTHTHTPPPPLTMSMLSHGTILLHIWHSNHQYAYEDQNIFGCMSQHVALNLCQFTTK